MSKSARRLLLDQIIGRIVIFATLAFCILYAMLRFMSDVGLLRENPSSFLWRGLLGG